MQSIGFAETRPTLVIGDNRQPRREIRFLPLVSAQSPGKKRPKAFRLRADSSDKSQPHAGILLPLPCIFPALRIREPDIHGESRNEASARWPSVKTGSPQRIVCLQASRSRGSQALQAYRSDTPMRGAIGVLLRRGCHRASPPSQRRSAYPTSPGELAACSMQSNDHPSSRDSAPRSPRRPAETQCLRQRLERPAPFPCTAATFTPAPQSSSGHQPANPHGGQIQVSFGKDVYQHPAHIQGWTKREKNPRKAQTCTPGLSSGHRLQMRPPQAITATPSNTRESRNDSLLWKRIEKATRALAHNNFAAYCPSKATPVSTASRMPMSVCRGTGANPPSTMPRMTR